MAGDRNGPILLGSKFHFVFCTTCFIHGLGVKTASVVGDVANCNGDRRAVSSLGIAIRVGDMGRHCFRFSTEIPERCNFLRRGLGGCYGSLVAHKGIRYCISIRSLRRHRVRIGIGRALTTNCIGTLGRLSREFNLGSSVSTMALSHCPSIVALRGTSRSRRQV